MKQQQLMFNSTKFVQKAFTIKTKMAYKAIISTYKNGPHLPTVTNSMFKVCIDPCKGKNSADVLYFCE